MPTPTVVAFGFAIVGLLAGLITMLLSRLGRR
jgi:hypothetical protein